MNKHLQSLTVATGMVMALSYAGCTKTETIAPPPLDQNRILEYKIVNVQGDPVYGSINDKENSITVYLPYSKQLVALEPEIKVSEGASLQPASGTMIEDLLDVFRKGRDIKYTVSGKDSKTRTYTLNIVVQQPPVVLTELSNSATDIKEYEINVTQPYANISFKIKGSGFHENMQLMETVLVDETGKESLPLIKSNTNTNNIFELGSYIYNSDDSNALINTLPTTGLYKIRVYSYSKQATMQFPIRITKTQ